MPRRLLRDGLIVEDEFGSPGDAGLGNDDPVILTFAEWQVEHDRWLARGGALGVVLAPADPVENLVPYLPNLALVGAQFPGPSEGRGYTQGRLLRERFGFGGELRARGAVRRDQVFLLARCGFNSFELPEAELEFARAALATFSAAYQPANDAGLLAHPRQRAAPSR